jgi:transcriptional regulator with XRE-family HTH domain
MSISFSEKIELLRKAIGLSQAEFAAQVGVSVNTYKGMVKRGSSPRFELVEQISQRWPCYALWLMTGEDAPMAGQYLPESDPDGVATVQAAYQVIDVVGRDLDEAIVRAEAIERVAFLHTCEVPYSERSERLLTTTAYHRGKFASSVPKGDSNFGTGMMLVLRGSSGAGFKRVVLVESGNFDLREIAEKGGVFGLLGDFQRWFAAKGIRQFDIYGIHPKTLWAACSEMDELRTSDLYDAPLDVQESFSTWCASF